MDCVDPILLCHNQPLVDGNKKIALAVEAVFPEINGHALDTHEAEGVIIYQQLADGRLTEEAMAEWIWERSVLDS